MNDLHRGEIYYISRGVASYGHEQQADRPAVIVSNEKNNENSELTTSKQKLRKWKKTAKN